MKDEKDLLNNEKAELNSCTENTDLKAERKHLTKKAVMALIAGVVVVVVLAAVAIAWYTRVTNTYSVTFEVADYDLAINKDDEEFLLNVYDYSQVVNRKMVPGTIGWFPLEVSAKYSQVDTNFSIAIENLMPEKVAKHFRHYYLTEAIKGDDGKYTYSIHYGDALETIDAQNDTLTDDSVKNKSDDELIAMGLIYPSEVDKANGKFPKYHKVYMDTKDVTISDVMPKGKEKKVCIYWEWYYDAYRANTDHGSDGFTFYYDDTNKATWATLTAEQKTAAIKIWDDLDTDIGRYPQKYKDSLQIALYATGAQTTPANGTKSATKYGITVQSITGGTVTANTASAAEGAEVTLTVTPDSGKQLKSGSLTVTGATTGTSVTVTDLAETGKYVFNMPDEAVNITAVFEEETTPAS